MNTELFDNPYQTLDNTRLYRYDNTFGARVDVVGDQIVVTPVRWTGDEYAATNYTLVQRRTVGSTFHAELDLRTIKATPMMGGN